MSMSSPAATSPDNAVTPAGIKRLLIVRLGAMGDIVHTLPAATALREAFPEVVLGWLIEERWTELLCALSNPRSGPRSAQRPLVDRIHAVETRRWRSAPFSPQTWERIGASLSDVRAAGYEVAVDLQGAVRSALLARWSGAPVIYGAAQSRENMASMFYTRQVVASGDHIVEQNLSLAEAVARRPLKMPGVEFPHDPAAENQCDAWLKERDIGNFVLLTPGAGWGAKQWPAERYGLVARCLVQDGLKSVVNFGPGEETLVREVEAGSAGSTASFAGSLTQLITLTRRARLYIGGDTGPMHLAAALQIPVVAIFGPTDPTRNGPFGTRNVVLRSPSSTTSYKHVRRQDQGLPEISADEVLGGARQLLKGGHG